MNLFRQALESEEIPAGTIDNAEKTIVMKGPLSEVYTQALHVAYAKDDPVDAPTVTETSTDNKDVALEAAVDKKKKDSKDKKEQIKVKKNSFHKWLHKNPGEKITDADIEKGLKSDDPHVRKMAIFAKNAKKWHDKATMEAFDIVAFDKVIMESQQMDVAIMQKLAASINDNGAPPTDNFQTIYGVSKDDVTDETVVEVTSELAKDNGDFVLILDAVNPSSSDAVVDEKVVNLSQALETITLSHGCKVFHSLKEYSESL